MQQILASDLIPDYDQPGYYRSVAVSFCCTGEDSDFLSMLDDMAANYPSVQLVSFSIDTRSFADTDGSALGIAADDGLFDPLTIIGGTIEMKDGRLRQSFDCRYPTSTTAEHLTEMMTQVCGTAATLEDVSSRVPFYIAADSPAIQTLITTYNDVTGENKKPLPWAAVPMRVTSRMPSALARSIPTLSCRNSPVPCTVPTRAPRLKS